MQVALALYLKAILMPTICFSRLKVQLKNIEKIMYKAQFYFSEMKNYSKEIFFPN